MIYKDYRGNDGNILGRLFLNAESANCLRIRYQLIELIDLELRRRGYAIEANADYDKDLSDALRAVVGGAADRLLIEDLLCMAGSLGHKRKLVLVTPQKLESCPVDSPMQDKIECPCCNYVWDGGKETTKDK